YRDELIRYSKRLTPHEVATDVIHLLEEVMGNPESMTEDFVLDELKKDGHWKNNDDEPVWDFGYEEQAILVMKNKFPSMEDCV
ncbi:MAG: hypothetical protein ACXADH_15350, partial [Candidatus Kariarchaeaceae archaeon]